MSASAAQIRANQANARRSTGPRTEEGKAKSRANALKHGLCSSVVVPEDLEQIEARTSEWFFTLKPQNEYHAWLVDKIVVATLRIDRAERMERRHRDRRSLVAELAWDDDRKLLVEVLGSQLANRPGEILQELRRSPSGCDWLIGRWSLLLHAAEGGVNWTPEQATLAFQLMGTPVEFRQGANPGDMIDIDGRVVGSGLDRESVARREIAELVERRGVVDDLDEVGRSLAAADLLDESNPGLKNLRRYEGALHNRLRWYLSELRYISPHFKPSPDMMMRMVTSKKPAEGEPESAPQPRPMLTSNGPWTVDCPHPAFDIESDELPADGTKPDLFKILLNRQEKREKRAEARREARRRRAEKLRG